MLPALFVPLLDDNKQFQAVSIRGGTLAQDLTLKPLGTVSTTGMYFLFTETFTVAAGATLTATPSAVLVMDPGTDGQPRQLVVNGTLVLDRSQSLTFVRRNFSATSLVVNGTLRTTGTTIGQSVVHPNSSLSLQVNTGGRLIATDTVFTMPTVALANDSVLNAGDLVGNTFNTYVFTGYPPCAEQRQGVMLNGPEVSLVS